MRIYLCFVLSSCSRSRCCSRCRSQIDPHFLFNTLNVIQQMAGTESAYRTQALIMALSHLLRYTLMSNDEQVPLSREVRVVDEYYSIYHVRFGDRVQMQWAPIPMFCICVPVNFVLVRFFLKSPSQPSPSGRA